MLLNSIVGVLTLNGDPFRSNLFFSLLKNRSHSVYVQHFSRSWIYIALAKLKGIKTIVRFHNDEIKYWRSVHGPSNYFEYPKFLIKLGLICVSQWLCLKLSDDCVFLTVSEKLRLAPSCSKATLIGPIGEPLSREKRSSGANKRQQAIFVGNLTFRPNLEALKFIINHIALVLGDWEICIVGQKPNQAIDLPKNILLVGPVDDLASFYMNASLVLAPVEMGEGIKMKIFEALQYGCPVLATRRALRGYENFNRVIPIGNEPSSIKTAVDKISNLENEDFDEFLQRQGEFKGEWRRAIGI